MKTCLYLFFVIFLHGCFFTGTADSNGKTVNRDTVDTVSHVMKNQTDNFYVFDINTNIYVGNSFDDLHIINGDISGRDAAISPDGKNVAYFAPNPKPGSIYLYDIKNNGKKLLKFPVDEEVSRPFFSRDGRFLAAAAVTAQDSFSKVLVYSLEQDTFKRVGKDTVAGYNPTFSPDGKKIVFHDMERIFVYDFFEDFCVKKNKIMYCRDFCPQDGMGISEDCKFQLSSNGKFMYYTYDNSSAEDTVRTLSFACYEMETGKITYLCKKGKSCSDFQISDLGQVYFLVQDSTGCGLYLCDLGSGETVRVSKRKIDTPCSFSVSY